MDACAKTANQNIRAWETVLADLGKRRIQAPAGRNPKNDGFTVLSDQFTEQPQTFFITQQALIQVGKNRAFTVARGAGQKPANLQGLLLAQQRLQCLQVMRGM